MLRNLAFGVVSCLFTGLSMGQAPPHAYTERVSETAVGGQLNGASSAPRVSADGRYMVFVSLATDVSSQVAVQDGLPDIFRRDLWTGQVEHVSRNGTVDSNGVESEPAISPDGNWVAWVTTSTNLLPGLPPGVPQILMCDMASPTRGMQLVSKFGGSPGVAPSRQPDVAANGDSVVFRNSAGTGFLQICLWKRAVDAAFPITVQPGPILAYGNGASFDPRITADGRFVVYSTNATNLVANDQNVGLTDIHLVDVVPIPPVTVRLSQNAQGVQSATDSYGPTIDDSGNRIVFMALSGVFTGSTSLVYQAYLLDRTTGQFSLVSANGSGVPSSNGCFSARITRRGGRVAFLSRGSGLGGSNPGNFVQAWLRDLDSASTRQLSISDAGVPADQDVTSIDIDQAGHWAVFESAATTLEAGDTNGVGDVYASFGGVKNLAPVGTGPGIVTPLRPSRALANLRLRSTLMRDLNVERIAGQACASTFLASVVYEPGGGFVHGIVDCNGVFTPNGDLGAVPAIGLGDLVSISTGDSGTLALVVTTQAAFLLFRPGPGFPYQPLGNPQVQGVPAGALGRIRLSVEQSALPKQVRLYYTDTTLDALAGQSIAVCYVSGTWDCSNCPPSTRCLIRVDVIPTPFSPLSGVDQVAVPPGQNPNGHGVDAMVLGRLGQNGGVFHMSNSAASGGRASRVFEIEGLSFRAASMMEGKALLLGRDNRVYEFDFLSQNSVEIGGAQGGVVSYAPSVPPDWIDQGGLFLFAYGTPLAVPVPIAGLLGTQLAIANMIPTGVKFFAPGQAPTHQLQVPPSFPATTLSFQSFAVPLGVGGVLPHGGNLADVFIR